MASYQSHASDSSRDTVRDRFGFPQLLATTVAFVAATILLGVAAKATGSGLACDANWPLCNGGLLDLFPANFPSFFEWIHRVVAMLAGFLIVGTAAVAWRDSDVDSRITYAVTIGLILTPIQVYLGRETVRQYELTVLSVHFWTAVAIFLLFAGAAVLVWSPRLTGGHVSFALGAGAAAVPLHVASSPLVVGSYTPVVQTLQYALTLSLLFAGLVSVLVGPRRFADRRAVVLLGVTAVLSFLTVLLGRRAVMTFAPALDALYVAVAGALFVAFVVGAAATRRLAIRRTKGVAR